MAGAIKSQGIKMVPWWNKFAYIEELSVDTEFRGKGLGRALLTCAIDWAKRQGFPGVTLETQDNNVPACMLYEKSGFVLTGFDLYAGHDLLAAGHAAELLRGVATEGHPYNEP